MIIKRFFLCCGIIALAGPAYAQVELKTYADRDGYIDVQALTAPNWPTRTRKTQII